MKIDACTTAIEIAEISNHLSVEELAKAIELYGKHRHKEAKHNACDIITEYTHSKDQVEMQLDGKYITVEETKIITYRSEPNLLSKIMNIPY